MWTKAEIKKVKVLFYFEKPVAAFRGGYVYDEGGARVERGLLSEYAGRTFGIDPRDVSDRVGFSTQGVEALIEFVKKIEAGAPAPAVNALQKPVIEDRAPETDTETLRNLLLQVAENRNLGLVEDGRGGFTLLDEVDGGEARALVKADGRVVASRHRDPLVRARNERLAELARADLAELASAELRAASATRELRV